MEKQGLEKGSKLKIPKLPHAPAEGLWADASAVFLSALSSGDGLEKSGRHLGLLSEALGGPVAVLFVEAEQIGHLGKPRGRNFPSIISSRWSLRELQRSALKKLKSQVTRPNPTLLQGLTTPQISMRFSASLLAVSKQVLGFFQLVRLLSGGELGSVDGE